MFHDFLPAVEDAKHFSQIFLKMLESIFFPQIAALKIRIWCTKDLFPENMRKQGSLVGLIALILSCSELRNKFQLGNTDILSEIKLFTSEYLYLGLVMIFVRVFVGFTCRSVM